MGKPSSVNKQDGMSSKERDCKERFVLLGLRGAIQQDGLVKRSYISMCPDGARFLVAVFDAILNCSQVVVNSI